MDISRFKNRKRKRPFSWKNGFDAPPAERPDYTSLFTCTDEDVNRATVQYISHVRDLQHEFENRTSLTNIDMKLLIIGAFLQTIRWAFITNDKFKFSKASDADKILKHTGKSIANSEYMPATLEQIILDASNHRVPYDAMRLSERFKSIYPGFTTGLAGVNHRYLTLGHDPLIGLIVGTANIATNTLTVNKFTELYPSYHVVNQEINGKTVTGKSSGVPI